VLDYTRWEKVVRDKHSNLMGQFVSYEENDQSFYPISQNFHCGTEIEPKTLQVER